MREVNNETTQKGLLRHVCIRRAPSTGEISVVLVATSEILPHKVQFLSKLTAVEGVKCIYLNKHECDLRFKEHFALGRAFYHRCSLRLPL